MKLRGCHLILLIVILFSGSAGADPVEPELEKISERVYVLVGSTGGRTVENHALNANFGFVVTGDGVLLVDSGASVAGARLIESKVASVTDQPVRWVVNTGAQDHRWLGNGYFESRGAEIIALKRTVDVQRDTAADHVRMLTNLLKQAFEGTKPAFAGKPIDADRAELTLGGVKVEILWLGAAHFAGDAVVRLPEDDVVFSGDLVYVDRMLGILPRSHGPSWAKAFKKLASLTPRHIVPGHGRPCDLEKAQRDTGDYLDWLVANIAPAVEEWEPIEEVVERLADAPFTHLRHFEVWHRTNVNRMYLAFEGQE